MTMIQIVLIVAIVVLVFGTAIFAYMTMGRKQKQKNIELIRGKGGVEVAVDETDLQNKRRAEIARKLKSNKEGEEEEADLSKAALPLRLQQAGWTVTVTKFWLLSAISCAVFIGYATYMDFSLLIKILLAVTGFLGFPRYILRRAIKKRQKKFLGEFPDALEAVVRLLKAGMPVAEAVSMISREFEGPVGEEMSIIYDKQKIGVPLHEAAAEGCRRMPLPEMKMFAAGLAIQAQTGSSLSEVLMNLSGVIRARFRLKRKIMALSSEAIASAGIIGSLPPLVGFGLYMVNPEYLEPLFTTEFGKMLIMGAVSWMALGCLVMKQMINFKI